MTLLAAVALALALLPAWLFWKNLRLYRPPLPDAGGDVPRVSVLIPARDEARVIEGAVRSALASAGVDVEVVVLDDASGDATAALVSAIAAADPRVRLHAAPPLPPGWAGKQHACFVLAGHARHENLVFMDADVTLSPDGLRRLGGFLRQGGAGLVSGIPRQVTGTWPERLVIPLIHFVLLGFLPLERMRSNTHPGYAAGCGQLFMTTRLAYEQSGGHAAIRATFHDGLRLPRAYRRAGLMTDLCDLTDVASCRMYRGGRELWRGLTKNAVEGLGAPGRIVPVSLLLLGGQVLPFVLLGMAPWLTPAALVLSGLAALAAWSPRLLGAARFRQSRVGALLHPVGIVLLVAIQWHGLVRWLLRRPSVWKGRPHALGRAGPPAVLPGEHGAPALPS